jgi:hypothetical protein
MRTNFFVFEKAKERHEQEGENRLGVGAII